MEAIYLAEIDMQFDDTRAARIHRKKEARSKKEQTQSEFSPGRSIFVNEKGNRFATYGGIIDANRTRFLDRIKVIQTKIWAGSVVPTCNGHEILFSRMILSLEYQTPIAP